MKIAVGARPVKENVTLFIIVKRPIKDSPAHLEVSSAVPSSEFHQGVLALVKQPKTAYDAAANIWRLDLDLKEKVIQLALEWFSAVYLMEGGTVKPLSNPSPPMKVRTAQSRA